MPKGRDNHAGRHVALLRGVNVGGKHLISMPALVELFVELGCRNVKSYIQSGNVVFSATPLLARRLPKLVKEGVERDFGCDVTVLLRTSEELADIVAHNPYLRTHPDTSKLHVVFLDAQPTASAAAALEPTRSPPDEFTLRGRDIYLSCPNGMARTKLTNAYFDGKLSTTSTARNWNTVLALTGLARAHAKSA